LQAGATVLAVELDRDLAAALTETLGSHPGLTVRVADALRVDFAAHYGDHPERGRIRVVANIPYYITTPLILRLLRCREVFEALYLTVQREVAERISASPGGKAYGALTLACQYRAEARPVLAIPRGAFYPTPEVDSTLLRFDLLDAPRVAVASEARLFAVIRAAFGQRRKTLRNTLLHGGWPAAVLDAALEACGIAGGRRGETLALEEFARLSQALPARNTPDSDRDIREGYPTARADGETDSESDFAVARQGDGIAMTERLFHTAKDEEIKAGQVTDVYFLRTLEILKRQGVTKRAVAEVILKSFPPGWSWGVLAGIEEAAALLTGLPVTVHAFPEGTLFGAMQPVLMIEGRYIDFAHYETALLGLLCQASGVATKAARCKKAAAGHPVVSFGARRMHPALAPMIERNAYLGGCDGVAVVKSAELIKVEPSGTMPHSLILMLGDTVVAAKAFHEIIDRAVRRVVLIDTFGDEKMEAVRVAEALGPDLYAVRLDTPASRRGDLVGILREVRWELDLRGFHHVRLFVSGGLDEDEILRLNSVADAYGVGTCISNAPVLNFSMDIVEVDGIPVAKRGKLSGRKAVYRCARCTRIQVVPAAGPRPDCCGGELTALLQPLVQDGRLVRRLPDVQAIRQQVLTALDTVSL
ncbi:MAG: nicotinate phosphoribosyltransferase, partial [candidate division NC10 bacterium]